MMDVLDPAFATLTRKISVESGFHCGAYKSRCLQRRIAVRMRARGVHTYEEYARLLDGDPSEYERLLDALTINVTKLFRNPETYAAIQRLVLPELWRGTTGELRVWSAGCASGEEPYSLAVLFADHAESCGQPQELVRVRILGSDIDRASLRVAEEGRYAEHAFVEAPPALRERWFGPGPGGTVHPRIRSLVRFERRDLLQVAPPTGPFHLVVCRNVLIYLDRHAQERLLRRFHDVLAPGGFLVLGKVETIIGEPRDLFAPVDTRERIYRRRTREA